MFNETSYFGYLGDRTPECQAIKDNCDSRFPPSSDPEILAGMKPDLNWDCMKATGYVSKCMDSKGYATPGGDNYLIDTLTNPDNPGYVLPNFGLGSFNTPSFLIAGAAILGALFLLRR